jgi:hypothetical protein
MKAALATLIEFTGEKSHISREQISSLSFSCVTPEVLKNQIESRQLYAKGAADAFSPLKPNGRPIRYVAPVLFFLCVRVRSCACLLAPSADIYDSKYSEGRRDHWFHSEENGLSVAGQLHLT